MLVCVAKGFALFRTYFDEKYDLIQKFRGIELSSIRYNQPVDFMESGLMQRDKWDYWHIDVPLALNTDEAAPVFINDSYIGANHGHNGAVQVYAPKHNKTFADVGSLWQDDLGNKFTLLTIVNEDYLIFVSENAGESVENYSFVKKIVGNLIYLENGNDTEDILPEKQNATDLCRAIRHKAKNVYAFIDGKDRVVNGEIICDYAEIREEYDIINPTTVAEDLRKQRPNGGYKYQPNLAEYGKPMMACSLVYRVLDDGTILTIFNYKKLMNVRVQKFMGLMNQEKLDVYSGGIWRYFPKILPFDTPEGHFDYSQPSNITAGNNHPRNIVLNREYFRDNNSPCERVVDYFRDKAGQDRLGFASGFLPVYDGQIKVRDKRVSNVLHLILTRKHYPTFTDKDFNEIKGVAYKKYFIPKQNKCSVYTVSFEDKKYLYIDVFENKEIKVPYQGDAILLEKGESIDYKIEDDTIIVSGEKGYAVFVLQ